MNYFDLSEKVRCYLSECEFGKQIEKIMYYCENLGISLEEARNAYNFIFSDDEKDILSFEAWLSSKSIISNWANKLGVPEEDLIEEFLEEDAGNNKLGFYSWVYEKYDKTDPELNWICEQIGILKGELQMDYAAATHAGETYHISLKGWAWRKYDEIATLRLEC